MNCARVVCCLAAVAVCGCGTASQPGAVGNRDPEGLLFTWAVVDLHTREVVVGPEIRRLPAPAFCLQRPARLLVMGGYYCVDEQGRTREGPSYGLFLAPDGQTVNVTMHLARDGKTHGAERTVPLTEGNHCVVFLPEEAPEFAFILGIDAVRPQQAAEGGPEFVRYVPIDLKWVSGDPILRDAPGLYTAEHAIAIQLILYKYNVPFTVRDQVVYIPPEVARDRDLLFNYTDKARAFEPRVAELIKDQRLEFELPADVGTPSGTEETPRPPGTN